MELTVAQTLTAYPALARLASEKVAAATAYRVSRIKAELETGYRAAQQHQVTLMQQHGGEQIQPGTWHLAPDKFTAEYRAELAELMAEVAVEVKAKPLSLADLAGVRISADDLAALDWMIEAPAEE